jgi:tetratricopeptide (TPR) repeat protein
MRVLASGVALAALMSSATAFGAAGNMQSQAAPSAAPAQPSIQQAFEAATTLQQDGKWDQALEAYRALEQRVGTERSKAIMRLRESKALMQLGRFDEARPMAVAALAVLPESDTSLRDDRLIALFDIAEIDRSALDYASAYASYAKVLRIAVSKEETQAALVGLIATGTFVDPSGTLAHAAEAQTLLNDPKLDERERAKIEIPVSQLYLNLGRYQEAKDMAMRAVADLGGLTSKTDLMDVAARSDVALAALKLKDEDTAREYLAMTGAGRSTEGFGYAAQMQAPLCGGEGGLRPEDMAVVEFAVGEDGSVLYAAPVYATRAGPIALEFARAVQDWSWKPDELKKLPLFYRYSARVELRCSTAFPRPAVTDVARVELGDWLREHQLELVPATSEGDARRVADQRAALAAAEAKGGNALALIPPLHALVSNSVVPAEERVAYAQRELDILAAAKAPALARLEVEWRLWKARDAGTHRHNYAPQIEAALQTPLYASDPLARASLRLMLVDSKRHGDKAQSASLLHAVSDDPAIEDGNPLKTGALIRLAAIEKSAGNQAAARAAFDRTGLNGEQCAMLDAPPKMTGLSQSDDYPQEAQRWGFEGWVTTQLDIDAEGRTHNQRALVAYPPFVFTDSAESIVRRARFAATYRPGGTAGCGGFTQSVAYHWGR